MDGEAGGTLRLVPLPPAVLRALAGGGLPGAAALMGREPPHTSPTRNCGASGGCTSTG